MQNITTIYLLLFVPIFGALALIGLYLTGIVSLLAPYPLFDYSDVKEEIERFESNGAYIDFDPKVHLSGKPHQFTLESGKVIPYPVTLVHKGPDPVRLYFTFEGDEYFIHVVNDWPEHPDHALQIELRKMENILQFKWHFPVIPYPMHLEAHMDKRKIPKPDAEH